MGAFGGLILTNQGRALQAKVQAGVQLLYTQVKIGDGNLGGQSIPTLTNLISPKKSLSILKVEVRPGGIAVIGTKLANSDVTEGFYFREIGVFAQDPDVGEILYCYANAGANAEYIPPGGGPDIIEKYIDVRTLTGNAANVSATIDESLVFVSQQDFDDHKNNAVLDHPDGSVTDVKVGPRTITDTSAPTGDTGTITNLFSWLANMIKAITGKSSWRTVPVKSIEGLNNDISNLAGAGRTTETVKGNADALAAHLADENIHIRYDDTITESTIPFFIEEGITITYATKERFPTINSDYDSIGNWHSVVLSMKHIDTSNPALETQIAVDHMGYLWYRRSDESGHWNPWQKSASDGDLAAHKAETAKDGVHGLGNLPMVSTAPKTYYIDAVNGNDNNDGLTTGTAFKTWGKAESMIPRFIYHTFNIKIIGNLSGIITLYNRILYGSFLIIGGNTTTPGNQQVSELQIKGSVAGWSDGIKVQYLRVNGPTNIAGCLGVMIENCEPQNPGGIGVNVTDAVAQIINCNFGQNIVQDAISSGLSRVYSANNSGNATRYGLSSGSAGTIGKFGTQPTGTVANENTTAGGVIR